MGKFFEDNSLSIGNTPLVKLNRVTAGLPCTILAKIEGRNPSYSVKCRIGAAMIWDAERRGILPRGSNNITIVEPTSGNTGIALAFVAASRGYSLILTMPETMSIERRRLLKAFGHVNLSHEAAVRDVAGQDDRKPRAACDGALNDVFPAERLPVSQAEALEPAARIWALCRNGFPCRRPEPPERNQPAERRRSLQAHPDSAPYRSLIPRCLSGQSRCSVSYSLSPRLDTVAFGIVTPGKLSICRLINNSR